MPNPIFRKKSLATLSSPEQLDQVMRVTRPMGWAGLAACFLLIAMALVWGVTGKINTVTTGNGILLKEGAIYDVVSLGTGQIQKIHVRVGDRVAAGQVVARLFLPELDQQIKAATDRLSSLESERKMSAALGERTSRIQRDNLSDRRKALEKALENPGPGRAEMELKQQLSDISVMEMELETGIEKQRFDATRDIDQARLRARTLQKTRALKGRITSPRAGRVLEVYSSSGKVIRAGDPILSIELDTAAGNPLSAFLYFSPREGKKIRQGMTVRISPSTVKTEAYGYMIGAVRHVSGFPASRQGMRVVLQNPDLVTRLSAGGAPIAVTADLLPDPSTVSGFTWSSGTGPDTRIESGTLCAANVIVDSQAPIRLVLPFLKKNVLGIGERQHQRGQN